MSKIVDAYIVYDLDDCPKNHLKNFKFENYLFGATDIVKNSHKGKWVYSDYGTALTEQVHAILVMTILGMLWISKPIIKMLAFLLTFVSNTFGTIEF